MKRAIIMRGLPGSGKSYLANRLLEMEPDAISHSTDDYFLVEEPVDDSYLAKTKDVYRYDPSKLALYQKANLAAFEASCKAGTGLVICDNTNMERGHFLPYIQVADRHGYEVAQIIVGSPANERHQKLCAARNQHGVSMDAIQRMGSRFEL